MQLQDAWDQRLRASGFKDIEGGADTNLISGSTFRRPSDNGGHGATVVLGLGHGDDDQDERPSIFETARARAWARFSQAAHELPIDAQMRAILVDVGESGSLIGAATRNGVSRFVVYDRATRLCEAIGIDRRLMFDAVTDVTEPAPPPAVNPARRLTKREIKRLCLEAPRERKAC